MKKFCITFAIIAMVAGTGMLIAGFAINDWRVSTLSTETFEKVTYHDFNGEVTAVQFIKEEEKIRIRLGGFSRTVHFKKGEHLSVIADESENLKVKVSVQNKTLYIQPTEKDVKILGWANQTITVTIPEKIASIQGSARNTSFIMTDLSVAQIDLISTNAQIQASNVDAVHMNVKTTNGRISMENVTVPELQAQTTNSGMSFQRVNANEVVVGTTNGQITLDGVTVNGAIKLTTSNSMIKVNDTAAETLSLTSANGGIRIYDSRIQKDITAKTTNSSVKIEDVDVNAISVNTTNGGISISDTAATVYQLKTTNASIHAQVFGDIDRYSIETQVGNKTGQANIPDKQVYQTQERLHAETTNGGIRIEFTNRSNVHED